MFKFDMNSEAAETNLSVLREHGMNLSKALKAQEGSPLDYGSEFRPIHKLERIFKNHPNWDRIKKILEEGSDWPLKHLSKKERRSDLEEALRFGNHKGASSNQTLLHKLAEKDISFA